MLLQSSLTVILILIVCKYIIHFINFIKELIIDFFVLGKRNKYGFTIVHVVLPNLYVIYLQFMFCPSYTGIRSKNNLMI